MGKFILNVHWSGVTSDISYYDGSKPDTIIEVTGEFRFEEYLDW